MEQPQKSSNNTLLIVIIVVIFAGIVIVGVGGYFGWKYYKSKITTGAVTTTSPSPTATLTTSPKTSPTATATPTPTASLSASKSISGDYVIADSNTRVIQQAELVGLTPWQLKVARNEIYARHGRPFVHKDLQCYFASKGWYQINSNFSESALSTVENKNVATIQNYEQIINSPMQSKDTGC